MFNKKLRKDMEELKDIAPTNSEKMAQMLSMMETLFTPKELAKIKEKDLPELSHESSLFYREYEKAKEEYQNYLPKNPPEHFRDTIQPRYLEQIAELRILNRRLSESYSGRNARENYSLDLVKEAAGTKVEYTMVSSAQKFYGSSLFLLERGKILRPLFSTNKMDMILGVLHSLAKKRSVSTEM